MMVFMMTDGLQFVGIVSYVNLVSQYKVEARAVTLVLWLGSVSVRASIATVQSGSKMSSGFKQSHCLAFR